MSHLACVQAGSAPRNKDFAAKRITCLIRIASSRVNDPAGIWVFFVLLHYVLRHAAIDRGLAQLTAVDPARLLDTREVGRGKLPSTMLGLLVHAAEHSTRHMGQALTTARILGGRP